ncbi:hypothetical protein CHARACLAT_017757 [Characodon lateralis]|uniref:Uncharacterized protein n=1 Tax=Characodon lateralis TaxID=208331 RepID=A0ABU7EL83_9TELE|nr:hypothetical protein [Characodon lateralis]
MVSFCCIHCHGKPHTLTVVGEKEGEHENGGCYLLLRASRSFLLRKAPGKEEKALKTACTEAIRLLNFPVSCFSFNSPLPLALSSEKVGFVSSCRNALDDWGRIKPLLKCNMSSLRPLCWVISFLSQLGLLTSFPFEKYSMFSDSF